MAIMVAIALMVIIAVLTVIAVLPVIAQNELNGRSGCIDCNARKCCEIY